MEVNKKNVDFPGQRLLNETLLDAIFYLASMCLQVCVYVCVCMPTPGPKSRSTGFGELGLGFGWNEWTQLCAQRYVHSLTHSNLLSVICSFSI